MKLTRSVLALALALGLSACASDDSASQDDILSTLGKALLGGGGPELVTDLDPATVLTQDQVAELPAPMVVIFLPDRTAWASLQQAGQNGADRTFVSIDGAGLTLQGGVLRSSRGMSGDLYASNPGPVVSALRNGGGSYTRTLSALTPLSQVESTSLTCQLTLSGTETVTIAHRSHATRRYTESCSSEELSYQNSYWVAAGGLVVRSHQWLSAEVGSIDIYALKM